MLVLSLLLAIKSLNHPLASPGASGDFVFVVGGDNRPTAHGAPPPRVTSTIFSEIRLIHPDFVLWSGDTIYGYRDTPQELRDEYADFVERAKYADVPIFNAPGNHEIHPQKPCTDHDSENQFREHFGELYGSFDYRGAHFIALDTEECRENPRDPNVPVVEGQQLEWLKSDLEAAKNARAIFVFFHSEVTPAPNDEEWAGHKPLGNGEDLHALFRKYKVKAVFQGHEHLFYAKTMDGVQYFVAGGAGAPLYAPPENGGFSHYVVVTVKGDRVSYQAVEPGRLYVEQWKGMTWLVNSTDLDLPIRRMELTVPSSMGTCDELTVESRLTKWDGTPIPVPVEKVSCTSTGTSRELTIAATNPIPRRSSIPIVVHKR